MVSLTRYTITMQARSNIMLMGDDAVHIMKYCEVFLQCVGEVTEVMHMYSSFIGSQAVFSV